MDFKKEIPHFLHSEGQNSDLRTKIFIQTLRVGDTRFMLFGNIQMKTYNHMNTLAEITYSIHPANFLTTAYQYVTNSCRQHNISFTTPNLAHGLTRDLQALIDEAILNSSKRFINTIERLLIKIDEDLIEAKNTIEIVSNELDIKLDEIEKDNEIPEHLKCEYSGMEISLRNMEILTQNIKIEKLESYNKDLNEALKALKSNFIVVESEKEFINNEICSTPEW